MLSPFSNLSIWACHMEYDFVHKMSTKTEGITSSKWRAKCSVRDAEAAAKLLISKGSPL